MVGAENIIETINTVSSDIINKYNVTENFIDISENSDGSISVWLTELTSDKKTRMAFKLSQKGKKGSKYFCITVKKEAILNIDLPENAEIKEITSGNSNIIVNFPIGFTDFDNIIKQILIFSVDTFEPSDKFGCCSKYKECSKAKKCLHDNQFYAKACWYRKNLESGNIFY